jgi:hypothetical protein
MLGGSTSQSIGHATVAGFISSTCQAYVCQNQRSRKILSCFIDLGCNQLLCVFQSSKFGKTGTLEPSNTNQYPIELPPKQPPTPKATMKESIIANN